MDVGVFTRSRTRFWAWMLCPLLSILALQLSVWLHYRRAQRTLNESRRLLELMPEAESKLQSAGDMIRRFVVPQEASADAAEVVRTHIGRTAQQHGFVVNSLSVEKGPPWSPSHSPDQPGQGAGQLPFVVASIAGEGTLTAVIEFLNELQRHERLVTVESASLRATGAGMDPACNAALGLHFYLTAM